LVFWKIVIGRAFGLGRLAPRGGVIVVHALGRSSRLSLILFLCFSEELGNVVLTQRIGGSLFMSGGFWHVRSCGGIVCFFSFNLEAVCS
jgi:hypothetical protein